MKGTEENDMVDLQSVTLQKIISLQEWELLFE